MKNTCLACGKPEHEREPNCEGILPRNNMKQKRGVKAKLTNGRACIFVLEGEQKSYIDALAARRKVSQSTVLRDMITYWADGHKI